MEKGEEGVINRLGCFDSEDSGRVTVTVVGLVDNEIPSSGLT